MNILNHARFPLIAACLASGLVITVIAQLPVPEPPPAQAEHPITLNPKAPLKSLEDRLETGTFEERGPLANAFTPANHWIDARLAELRAEGLVLVEEAETNLATAREDGAQVFRYLSFATAETWANNRHNAVLALRKIQGALGDLERTATKAR